MLYCISFFTPITSYTVLSTEVTAVDHLDAAMAQITVRPFFLYARGLSAYVTSYTSLYTL